MNADEDTTVQIPAPTRLAASASANVLHVLITFALMVCLGLGKKHTWLGSEKHQVSPQTQQEIFLFKNIRRRHTYKCWNVVSGYSNWPSAMSPVTPPPSPPPQDIWQPGQKVVMRTWHDTFCRMKWYECEHISRNVNWWFILVTVLGSHIYHSLLL